MAVYDPARREAARHECRRPIEPWEVPHLECLAAGLRSLRSAVGMSQIALAIAAGLSPTTLYRIEAAVRRTRASTLQRIATALVEAAPGRWTVEGLTADLATLAGMGLAPESGFRGRVERRRARRGDRQARQQERTREIQAQWARWGPGSVG